MTARYSNAQASNVSVAPQRAEAIRDKNTISTEKSLVSSSKTPCFDHNSEHPYIQVPQKPMMTKTSVFSIQPNIPGTASIETPTNKAYTGLLRRCSVEFW